MLPLIYQELQELKLKNAELESKLDSLAAPANGATHPGSVPIGSAPSSLRRRSAGGLTPVDISKPTKLADASSNSGASISASPITSKLVPKDGTGLHVNQKTLNRIQEVEDFYADNRVILTTYPNQVRELLPPSPPVLL